MGCGCGGKPSSRNIVKTGGSGQTNTNTDKGSTYNLPSNNTDITDTNPSEWGPIFWNVLHTVANKLGLSKNEQLDSDQGYLLRHLVATCLPTILPCQQCQQHVREYMSVRLTRVPEFESYRGNELNIKGQTYLFKLHNAVRTRLGQPIVIHTIEECMNFYKTQTITPEKMELLNKYGLYGVNQKLVSIANWKSFMTTVDKLRLLSL